MLLAQVVEAAQKVMQDDDVPDKVQRFTVHLRAGCDEIVRAAALRHPSSPTHSSRDNEGGGWLTATIGSALGRRWPPVSATHSFSIDEHDFSPAANLRCKIHVSPVQYPSP